MGGIFFPFYFDMEIQERDGKMEGWLHLIRFNRFGLQYSRKRYFILEDNCLKSFKSIPTSVAEVCFETVSCMNWFIFSFWAFEEMYFFWVFFPMSLCFLFPSFKVSNWILNLRRVILANLLISRHYELPLGVIF